MNTKKRNSGFSLVEIMVVVAIIGILSATVAISISGYVLERKEEQKVVELFSMLQQMRSYAHRDNTTYTLNLTARTITPASGSPLFPNLGNVLGAITFQHNSPAGAPTTTAEGAFGSETNGWQGGLITFSHEGIGEISKGVIYIQNTANRNVWYAITSRPGENFINLRKWSGNGNWNEL